MTVRKISWIALFVSLSIVGAYIKIPSPVGSTALDIFPALVAAVLLDKKAGAMVGALGHSVSALFVAMPLGIFHVLIALEMAVIVWLFGYFYRSNRVFASLLFIFLNGIVASAPFILIMSFEFYLAITPGLLLASTLNVILAVVLLPKMEDVLKAREVDIPWSS